MSIVRLAWTQKGTRYEALTLWGKLEIVPMPVPFTMDLTAHLLPFRKPQMGYGIFHKGKRVAWTADLIDAEHHGVAYITQYVNQLSLAKGAK